MRIQINDNRPTFEKIKIGQAFLDYGNNRLYMRTEDVKVSGTIKFNAVNLDTGHMAFFYQTDFVVLGKVNYHFTTV